MIIPPRAMEWGTALAEAAVVLLSGVAAYRLAGEDSDGAMPALIVVSGAVAALWILLLNPWSRWSLPPLTRAVCGGGLAVVTAVALVMTGLFWWAALLVLGGVLIALVPVLEAKPIPSEEGHDRR